MNQRPPWTERLVHFIIARPKFNILWVSLLTLLLIPGLSFFQENYDVRIWFVESDPNIQTLDRFERQFGNDESLIIAARAQNGFFTRENLLLLDELTNKAWELPQVIRVDSLANYNISRVDGDDILVEPFLNGEELTDEVITQLKQTALTHRVIPDYLLSRDAHSVMIFARLTPTLEASPNYELIVQKARALIADYADLEGIEFHLIGEAAVNDALREVSNNDSAKILPIMLVVLLLYLYFTFRSVMAVALTMVVVTLSILMTLGFGFYLGYQYNQILSVLPAVLIAISIADCVHIILSYLQFRARDNDGKEALYLALKKNIIPTVLTTASTVLGFLSLTFTDLLPVRELGLLAAVGGLFAWILTLFLVAPILLFFPLKAPARLKKFQGIQNSIPIADAYIAWVKKWRLSIIAFFSILIVGSFYLTTLIRVNSNPFDYFSERIELRNANRFVQKHFGGSSGPELIISSGRPDGIKEPDFLRRVEIFKNWLDEKEFVNKTVDMIDIIKEVNQNLNQGQPEFYRLPETQEEVAQQLFFYTFGLPQGMDLNNRMSLDFESMRMSVLWNIQDTRGWLKQVDILEAKASELGLNVETTGKFLLFQRMMDYVVMTFFQSIMLAMILVALLMSLLFRSFKLGLLSLIPNIIPLFIGAGFMYLAGIDLNIGSAIVASVCLGIAIDDTIHFLSQYYRLRGEGLSVEKSMAQIMTFTGAALISTTVILVSCFGLYIMGDFVPTINFGVICAVVLAIALLIDLVFLPAILLALDERKKKAL